MSYSLLTFSPNEILTSAKMNQVSDNFEALRDGSALLNDVILNQHILAGEISMDKTDGSFGYEYLGRTTLGVAGDVINLSSIPAKKYLRIFLQGTASGGTLDTNVTFNNDTGANYNSKYQIALNGTVTDGVSLNAIAMESGAVASGGSFFAYFDIVNIANREKHMISTQCHSSTGAAATMVTITHRSKWVNTSVQINRVTWTNTGTGDFAIGSELMVFGKD